MAPIHLKREQTMKRILLGTLFAAASFNAFADAPGGAGCGWGNMLFKGQRGVATHVVVAAADMDDTSIFGRLCRSGLPEPYTISCVESRDDTRGEAQILGRFANRQG